MTSEAVLRIKWDSGVVAYLREAGDGELATRAHGGGWNIRPVDTSAYLADVQMVSPRTDEVPIEDSPWGERDAG